VALFWSVLGTAGALPLILSDATPVSFTDAVFESISGLTTTGSTVLIGLDTLPYSILFYRQELQWLGGMGIIVLALAVLPMLGVGGMQLYRAETPGPIKDAKLTPRITETAKFLWLVYVGLTALCALTYWMAGMSIFDAVAHAFSTVSTGGYSPYDASFGHFDSATLEMIAVVFMALGGTNFALHFAALRRRSISPYIGDAEFRTYLGVLIAIATVTVGYLYATQHLGSFGAALHHGIFQVVSITTSTGYTTASFSEWPLFLPLLLIFASFMGGCASSTSGGMKTIRILLLFKQGYQATRQLIHPSAMLTVRIGSHSMDKRVVEGVWGFLSAYLLCFTVGLLALMALGMDQVTAFSAMAACLNNLGPGLGEVAANFRTVSDAGKWILSLAMLLGRLEIFTLLVLLTPDFWRP
jgi:trk system potassium uptake protein TrkH